MATVTINGISTKVKNGTSILKAAQSVSVSIPTLCFLNEVNDIGLCKLCVVEVEGEDGLVTSCNTQVTNKMRIYTDTKRINSSRKESLKLLASKHRFDCPQCPQYGHCEFYNMLKEYDIEFDETKASKKVLDNIIKGLGINQDQSKCIVCNRCVSVCETEVTTSVLKFIEVDEFSAKVSPTIGLTFDEAGCINCGQCIAVCPTGSLFVNDHISIVEKLLKDKKTFVIAQTTPEVISGLIEEFDLNPTLSYKKVNEKLTEALYELGVDHSLDVSFANDLTTIELAFELEDRILNGVEGPLISSVCPSAVSYVEMYQQKYINNLSKVKGPHLSQGALLKTYYNEKYLEEDKKEISVISLVSCAAKKVEISRENLSVDDIKDVDAAITIKEFAQLLRKNNIDFKSLSGSTTETYFEQSSGASVLYGLSGGVTTSLIRTLYNVLEKRELSKVEFDKLIIKNHKRKGSITEIKVKMLGIDIVFAVVDGGVSMEEIFKKLDKNQKHYNFIELMTCSSGCINGGEMPIKYDEKLNEAILNRSKILYDEDRIYRPNPKAHLNKAISEIYENFLKQPRSKKAHKYLYQEFSSKDITNKQ